MEKSNDDGGVADCSYSFSTEVDVDGQDVAVDLKQGNIDTNG